MTKVTPEKMAEYEEYVKGPGKFECEARYVPYYWGVFLEGFADEDDGKILSFNVSAEDKENFPELKRRKVIKLYEDDIGFVREI
ncbi:MAG: hypothetical protein V1767_00660 [Chloroflexota bacterium]